MTNNTFQHGPGGLSTPIGTDAGGVQKPSPRTRVQNNLFWDLNGYEYYVAGIQSPALGWIIEGGYANEDMIINHNSIYDNRGASDSFLHWLLSPIEGVSITNNFMWYSDQPMFTPENVSNCAVYDKALMDCAFTSGPGNPAYTFTGNVIVPSWTNSSVPSGQQAQSTLQGLYSGVPASNSVMSSSMGGVPETGASIDWFHSTSSTTPDFHLQSGSAYISGGANHAADGLDVGANIDALLATQGNVRLIGVPNSSLTTSTASVVFVAPDSAGCPVDYSLTDSTLVTAFTRVADAGGPRVRSIALTGLTSGTRYFYRIDCAVQQPMGQFRTH